jgi:hypothetical protein
MNATKKVHYYASLTPGWENQSLLPTLTPYEPVYLPGALRLRVEVELPLVPVDQVIPAAAVEVLPEPVKTEVRS